MHYLYSPLWVRSGTTLINSIGADVAEDLLRDFPIPLTGRAFPNYAIREFPTLGSGAGGGAPAEPSDEFFSMVELLIGFDNQPDGSQIISDLGPDQRAITVEANAHIDTDVKKFGDGSLFLDGVGDFIHTPDSDTTPGNGIDFTMECFINVSSLKAQNTIANKRDSAGAEEFSFQVGGTGNFAFVLFNGTPVASCVSSDNLINVGSWHHVAATRVGSAINIWVDGIFANSVGQTGNMAENAAVFKIGRDGFNTGRDFIGWIDEFRYTKGVARYTTNFTPPTEKFPRQ